MIKVPVIGIVVFTVVVFLGECSHLYIPLIQSI